MKRRNLGRRGSRKVQLRGSTAAAAAGLETVIGSCIMQIRENDGEEGGKNAVLHIERLTAVILRTLAFRRPPPAT